MRRPRGLAERVPAHYYIFFEFLECCYVAWGRQLPPSPAHYYIFLVEFGCVACGRQSPPSRAHYYIFLGSSAALPGADSFAQCFHLSILLADLYCVAWD